MIAKNTSVMNLLQALSQAPRMLNLLLSLPPAFPVFLAALCHHSMFFSHVTHHHYRLTNKTRPLSLQANLL